MATETAGTAERATGPSVRLQPEDRVALLRHMLLMRAIEERAMNLYRQGKVPGSFYDGFGQEAVSVGAAFAMSAQDRLCILHRDLGAHLVRGVDPVRILAQYMGRADGITRGRDGNVHFGDHTQGMRRDGLDAPRHDARRHRYGDGLPHALRAALRDHLVRRRLDLPRRLPRGDELGRPSSACRSSSSSRTTSTRTPRRSRSSSSSTRSSAPRPTASPGVRVDGNDVEAMFDATWEARERALAGGGPTLLEAVTMRMHGHAAHDDMKYVPKEQVEEWRRKDPIDRQSARVAELGVDVDALREEVRAQVDAAVEEALRSPMPDPATATDGLFHEGDEVVLGDGDAPYSGFRSA